jgi:signal transduction histidine kinase
MERELILIVDDIPQNLQLLGNVLRHKGFEVAVATSGKQALKVITNARPSLILLDIKMPEMDGYEVCEIVKNDPETQTIPIIFLTGKIESEDIVKGFSLGAADYVTKPFNTSELLARVETHMEIQRKNHKIKKQNVELQELNASKDKFFSIIAHDVKNPFQGILGLSKLLEENLSMFSEEETVEIATQIHNSTSSLYKLLENLLEWSRVQLGKIPFEPNVMPINSIAQGNFELLSTNAEAKSITFQNNVPEGTQAYADYNMVTTIVRNLISNAIKFTPEGGTITVAATTNNDLVEISVIDTGVGIPDKIKEKLFSIEENVTTPGTNNEPGTGLGLILCKDLTEQNGGTISVESEEGKGTTFCFTLPIQAPQHSNM